LIDFPGINDAEDTDKQLFFRAVENRVSTADLIMFITDATTAFSKASELNEFDKIQQLVQQENAKVRYI
jgi:GTPase Era involved in 16S rRNA processing